MAFDSETQNILDFRTKQLGMSERDLLAASLKAQMAQIDALLKNSAIEAIIVCRRETDIPNIILDPKKSEAVLLSPIFVRALARCAHNMTK